MYYILIIICSKCVVLNLLFLINYTLEKSTTTAVSILITVSLSDPSLPSLLLILLVSGSSDSYYKQHTQINGTLTQEFRLFFFFFKSIASSRTVVVIVEVVVVVAMFTNSILQKT